MKNKKNMILFKNKIMILGFGCLGNAILPLLFKIFDLSRTQLFIVAKDFYNETLAKKLGLSIKKFAFTKENYIGFLDKSLEKGDFLLNLSLGISSLDLIQYCQANKILYLDASTEPWEGLYTDKTIPASLRTNYALREEIIKYKGNEKTTAVVTHGANPGLVSHFVKQALMNMARDSKLQQVKPNCAHQWAELAMNLGIKTIHIAERDTQSTARIKAPQEFVNTWSVEGLIFEASQPVELGWGTHERHWPKDAFQHSFGSNCGIYLNRSGARTKVRTWTPSFGSFNGFLITHAESLSIADYLTLKNNKELRYKPTVHYAYYPCPDATLSLHELAGRESSPPSQNRYILNEIVDGVDELGVLLMGSSQGAYWYGSQLSIHEARGLANNNNATSLQVVAGLIAAMLWILENPAQGLVEPEDIDYEFILNLALPYLGQVKGYYTTWNPLQSRTDLFGDSLDQSDPWQFVNMLIS